MPDLMMRDAQLSDLDRLVDMNLQLIEDEAYDAPLPRQALEARMREFFHGDFRLFIFETAGSAAGQIGYCIVDLSKNPVYVRHFFICRKHRRKGFGRAAMAILIEELGTNRIDVEVMAWNDSGRTFWRDLGFQHRYDGLRWTSPE